MVIHTRQPIRAAQIVTAWALEGDVDLAHFSVTQPSLEDIYLELTGTGAGAGPERRREHDPQVHEEAVA